MRARPRLAALLAIASALWALALVLVPSAAAAGSAVRVPTAISALVYVAGSTICHQRPERSFHAGGVRMPVCARCFGLYAAAPIGAVAALIAGMALRTRRRHLAPATMRLVLIAAALPTAIVWAVEWFGFAQPSSGLRAGLAAPLGAAAAWIVTTAIAGEIE